MRIPRHVQHSQVIYDMFAAHAFCTIASWKGTEIMKGQGREAGLGIVLGQDRMCTVYSESSSYPFRLLATRHTGSRYICIHYLVAWEGFSPGGVSFWTSHEGS